MAAVPLTLNKPHKVTGAGTAYQEFTYTKGRNLLLTVSADFFYHPDGVGKDAAAVNGTEQLKMLAGTYSIRAPGSGHGKRSVVGGQQAPNDATKGIAIAAVTGTVDIWIAIVPENVGA